MSANSMTLKALLILLLVELDMKYDADTVTLQGLLSANGVVTATPSVTAPKEHATHAKCCKNQPLYIFVTSGPAVQGFLKQVRLKPNQGKLKHIFSLTY
jgi:hypothetical protein